MENNSEEKRSLTERKSELIAVIASAAVMVVAAVVFVIIGAVAHIWHPTWLSFLCGIIVCIWIGEFTRSEAKNKSVVQKILSSVSGSAIMCAVVAYLLMGFLAKLWHPGWAVFPAAVALTIVIGIFDKEKKPFGKDENE